MSYFQQVDDLIYSQCGAEENAMKGDVDRFLELKEVGGTNATDELMVRIGLSIASMLEANTKLLAVIADKLSERSEADDGK